MTDQVAGSPGTGGVAEPTAPVTPAGGGVAPAAPAQAPVAPAQAPAAPATPAQGQGDAQLGVKLAEVQRDLNRMKSASQRREWELSQEFARREAEYRRQLHEAQIKGLDEAEREKAELQFLRQQTEQAQQALQQREAELSGQQQALAYYNYWLGKGVPPGSMDLSQGPDAVNEAGWAFMEQRLSQFEEMEKRLSGAPQTPATPTPAPGTRPELTPPPVVTQVRPPAAGGPTWAELIQKHGSEERVYRLVEQGVLPRDIIPGPRVA